MWKITTCNDEQTIVDNGVEKTTFLTFRKPKDEFDFHTIIFLDKTNREFVVRSDGVFELNKAFGKRQADYSLSRIRLSDSKKVLPKIIASASPMGEQKEFVKKLFSKPLAKQKIPALISVLQLACGNGFALREQAMSGYECLLGLDENVPINSLKKELVFLRGSLIEQLNFLIESNCSVNEVQSFFYLGTGLVDARAENELIALSKQLLSSSGRIMICVLTPVEKRLYSVLEKNGLVCENLFPQTSLKIAENSFEGKKIVEQIRDYYPDLNSFNESNLPLSFPQVILARPE